AAKNPDADEANRRGHTAAVFEQVVERGVAGSVQIHRDAVDDILERLPRQAERGNERLQAPPLRRARVGAIERARQLLAPEHDRLAARWQAGRRRRLLIDRVVDRTAEVPDRDDGAALLRGQDEERVIEA